MTKLTDLCAPRGWKGLVTLFLAGALGALAMEPFALWPVMFVSLMPLFFTLDALHRERGARSLTAILRRAALLGWVWGFGYLLAGLWWLGKAFLVDPEFLWAMPLGVIGLPGALALFYGFGSMIAAALWSRSAWRLFAFVFAFALAEWLRGTLFTGFPWNTLGMVLGNHLWLMQTAWVYGLYGLTVVTLLIFAAPALWIQDRKNGRPFLRHWPLLFSVLAFVALTGYGMERAPLQLPGYSGGPQVRIIQPNVLQDDKFTADNGDAIVGKYLAMTTKLLPRYLREGEPEPSPAKIVIWPESAFPFILHRSPDTLNRIGDALSPNLGWLITGAARMDAPLPGEERGTFFNSVQAIDSFGIIRDTYDKTHLVPFGEYVPDFAKAALRAVGLRQFVSYLPGGFTPASERKPFSVPGLPPIAIAICYEAIFPGRVLPESGPRPGLILNITNDAWFGDSPGPHQHFAQVRLRAVEEGLPVIRVANTGISGVIDAYGQVEEKTAINKEAVIDTGIPPALREPTLYSLWHEKPFFAMLLLCLIGAVYGRRRSRLRALREALISGEESGEPAPFDSENFLAQMRTKHHR